MRKGLLKSTIVWTVSLAALWEGAAHAAVFRRPAQKPDFRPQWVSARQVAPNTSYFSNLKKNRAQEEREVLLDDSQTLMLKQQYQDLTREYDQRAAYGVTTQMEDEMQRQRIAQFSRRVVGQVQGRQIRSNVEKLRGAVERDDNLMAVSKPVAVVGAIAAISMGTPVKFNLDSATQVEAQTVVMESRGHVAVNSPIVSGNVRYVGRNEQFTGPNMPAPIVLDERVRVSLSKPLPVWSITSGVSYGSSSQSVSASLSKPITNHLTCVVDSTQVFGASARMNVMTEESVRVLYGIQF